MVHFRHQLQRFDRRGRKTRHTQRLSFIGDTRHTSTPDLVVLSTPITEDLLTR